MKYDIVKKSIEEFVIANWVMTPINSIQFDDVAFNSDLFSEYVQLTVRFGDAQKRSLAAKCYRQIGLVILTTARSNFRPTVVNTPWASIGSEI